MQHSQQVVARSSRRRRDESKRVTSGEKSRVSFVLLVLQRTLPTSITIPRAFVADRYLCLILRLFGGTRILVAVRIPRCLLVVLAGR